MRTETKNLKLLKQKIILFGVY